jgi:hypothetical protein
MADVADIVRIEIRYEHTGWDVINETFVLVPVRRGGGFHLQGHYESTDGGVRAGEWPVTSTAVAQLLAALQERPWQRERAMREIAGGVRRSELIPATFWTTWPPLACDADELRALACSRHVGAVGRWRLRADGSAGQAELVVVGQPHAARARAG